MNYDKLIERLQRRARPKKPFIAQGEIWTGGMAKDELCADAVTAIETLRADLARVTVEWDAAEKEITRLKAIMRENGVYIIPAKYPWGKPEWNW